MSVYRKPRNYEALNNLAKAAEDAHARELPFCMDKYVWDGEEQSKAGAPPYHACNTPACLFGHFADRRDLQNVMELRDGCPVWLNTNRYVGHTDPKILDYFGITGDEADDFFHADYGCRDMSEDDYDAATEDLKLGEELPPVTAKQAARHVRLRIAEWKRQDKYEAGEL